jgi:uncharacterized membrane-anchored protein
VRALQSDALLPKLCQEIRPTGGLMSIPLAFHPMRDRLLAEAHARPSTPLEAPMIAVRLANVSGQAGVESDRAHMAALCRALALPEPDPQARWWLAQGSDFSLRWERHTEFSSWTIFAPAATASDPRGPLARLPAQWCASMPPDMLVATMIELRRDDGGMASAPAASDGVMIGASVLEGAARVFTDFRDDGAGMTRFRLLVRTGDASMTGRLVLILLEIETYRLMALLAFPLAGETAARLREIEEEAGVLASRLAEDAGVEADRTLLARLVALSGEAEALTAATGFRFNAASAYHDLVRDRVSSLREEEIAGLQTIAEFMERRLAPAMRTCDTVAAREQAVIARIARAGQMLNTRIEVAAEASSAALLESMNARADQSLRLQRTVEGLSVAAIAYYSLALLAYPVKALEHEVPGLDSTIVLALLAPLVAIAVWLALRRLRQKIDRGG